MSNSRALELAKQLIAQPSVTPHDGQCQALIAERLAAKGFVIEHYPFGAVKNLWARYGTEGPLLIYVGHTDVVPTGPVNEWTTPPFEPTVKDNVLYGRGACDMKGGVAAMVCAAERFVDENPDFKGSLGLLITSDEEGTAADGVKKVIPELLAQGVTFDYCLGGEPTAQVHCADMIKIGRRGSLNAELKVFGLQGHVAYPQKAVNPIHKAMPALAELTAIEWDKGNADFLPTSLQIANINAGTGASNVIPGTLEVQFNFRFSPLLTKVAIEQRVDECLQKHNLDYSITWHSSADAFYSEKGYLLEATQNAISQVMGNKADVSTTGGTSDVRFVAPHCKEIVECGLTNETIHQINECIAVEEIEQLEQVYFQLLSHLWR